MSKSLVDTFTSAVYLLAVDTDGALKKMARSVLATGVAEALGIDSAVAGVNWTATASNATNLTNVTLRNGYAIKIADVVVVCLGFSAFTSGAGPVRSVQWTLPFTKTTNFTGSELLGSGQTNLTTSTRERVFGVSGAKRIEYAFNDATAGTNASCYSTFMYRTD